MALPFSLFLALKYLKPKRTFLSVVTVISILGVMLGVAVLIIVLSVMSGFDEMWRDKILSFNAHITVTGYGIIQNEEELVGKNTADAFLHDDVVTQYAVKGAFHQGP